MKKTINGIAFSIAVSILFFVFLVIALTSVAFLLGGGVSKWLLVLSVIGSIGFLYYLLYKKNITKPWLWIGIFLSLLASSVWFGSVTIDSTYDGNSYHKTAIGALRYGWNPVRADINTFNSSPENSHKIVDATGADRTSDEPWVNSYPKASWIFAANIYKMTGNIESGKALNLLAVFIVFLLAFSYLYQKLGRSKSLLVSGLLAFNPVAVAQLSGYFIDGAMGNLMLALIILLTMVIDKKAKGIQQGPLLYIAISLILVIVINIKFTGLAYAGITVLCYWIYLLVKKDWKTVLRLSIAGAAALIFGLVVVGASSYIKNTSTHGHPLYPLAGNNSIDIMTHNQPASYADKSGIHKFIESNFGETANILRAGSLETGDTSLKVPFTISADELAVLGNDPDLRQAGYGVWFGGILLISLIIGIYLLVRYSRKYKTTLPLFLLPLASVAIIAIAFDNSWWARYLPQLYLLPIIVLIALMLLKSNILSKILLFTLLFNIILLGSLQADYQNKYASAIKVNLDVNLLCTAQPPKVYLNGSLSGAMYNIWDRCDTAIPMTNDAYDIANKTGEVRLINDIYLVPRG